MDSWIHRTYGSNGSATADADTDKLSEELLSHLKNCFTNTIDKGCSIYDKMQRAH